MSAKSTKPLLLLLPFLLTGSQGPEQEEDRYCPDFDGRIPPELRVVPDGWMNIEGNLSLEKLRGHVVWLEFSFIECGGCRMMKPLLYGLQHEFGARGLVVLEVDNGEVDARDALAQEVGRRQPNYPVLWDKEGSTCDAFGVEMYGTAYLIGADGRVLWGGNPIQLTVSELWSKVTNALSGVEPDRIAAGADRAAPFRLRARTAADAAPPPRDEERAYDVGYMFTICTSDNSMVINGVRPGTPAEHGGLKEGDVVLSIGDIVLSDVPFEVLKAKLHELEEGPQTVELRVERGGKAVDLVIEPPR